MNRDVLPDAGSADALRLDRAAGRWMEAGPERAPDRLRDAIVAALETTPQQRRRRIAWPSLTWRLPVRSMAAATVMVVLLATSAANLAGLGSLIDRFVPAACGRGSLVTVAGRGIGPGVDPLGAVPLDAPTGIAVGPDGTLFVSDSGAVWRIPPTGAPSVIAGAAPDADAEDPDQDPTAIVAPRGIALDRDGSLVVVDGRAPRIVRIAPDGGRTLVAGTGISGSTGDGGPAIDARVDTMSVAIGPGGEVYLDAASRYRVIDPDGTIHAFAGSGIPGWSGDGGPATEASMLHASGIAVSPAGRVFLGDQARVRMVDAGGVIDTIAGTGSSGPPDEAATARTSRLLAPGAMAVDRDDTLYLVDGAAVLAIDPAGGLKTVAGALAPGTGFHCGPALGPTLEAPGGLAVHDGALYIADTGNARVVKVTP